MFMSNYGLTVMLTANKIIQWNSLVEEGERLYLPNCQTNLVIALYTLSLLFLKFINTTAYHVGRYHKPPLSQLFVSMNLPLLKMALGVSKTKRSLLPNWRQSNRSFLFEEMWKQKFIFGLEP